MSGILTDLKNTVIAGLVLTVIMIVFVTAATGDDFAADHMYMTFIVRWLHVINGVMWIGLLWYFNFVQIPNMPNIPDDQKPAIGKVIAPAALFWFRWGAMGTIVFGLILAAMNGYLVAALTLGASEVSTFPKALLSVSACGWASSCGSTSGSLSGRTRKRHWAWSKSMQTPRPQRPAPRCCSRGQTPCSPSPCFTPWCRLRISTEFRQKIMKNGTFGSRFFCLNRWLMGYCCLSSKRMLN